jgi:methylated-DNA-[protein]-cysteine S-methyltransferase
MTTLDTTQMTTPIGPLRLLALGEALVALELDDRQEVHDPRLTRHLGPYEVREVPDPAGAVTRLTRYLAGELHALDDQPVRLLGTAFERQVWTELRRIPVGTTIAYGELATRVGRPRGPRAVGQANGRNPIALVVPCHRVIAADGTLGGYGGGLEKKRWLLRHEGAPVSG